MEARTDEQYAQMDKRTKEYKEWKAHQDAKSKGVGDEIAKVTKATGLDKVAEKVAKSLGYDDCGCDGRKKRLNENKTLKVLFGYSDFECLTEDEFNYLWEFFDANRPRVTFEEREHIYAIHNRVFRTTMKSTSCSGCFREVAQRLKRLTQEHKA